jgi:hypothetical protein
MRPHACSALGEERALRRPFAAVPLTFAVVAIVTPFGASRARAEVRVVSAMVKVMPDRPLPSGTESARLEAARGEWEPFQIALSGPVRGVRAEATSLRGPGGATLPPPRLHRVELVAVTTPSSVEGRPGRWPDALVPDVDAYVGERRAAFPFDVAGGETRAIWVDVFVPRGATPGPYRGEIVVHGDGRVAARVPVALLVHRFTLPATSSLPVTFGISFAAIARGHGLPRDASEVSTLGARYGVAALRHRVSLHGGSMESPPFTVGPGGAVELDTRAYDAEVGPLLDGCADRGGPAEGARWTLIDLRVPARVDDETRTAYVRAMVAHLRARGWLDRAFDYTFDEPKPEQLAEVRRRAARLRAATAEVPRLVTHAPTPELAGAVDVWCPVVQVVDPKPGMWAPFMRPPSGERLFWYQSCLSHGCNIVGGAPEFTGWPSLVVDAPAVAHRVLEWLTYRQRIGGELYFNTVEAWGHPGADPWRHLHRHGGNGDGTLFYPGTPATIGGKSHVPVESARLRLVREGLEDYEYLRLYERAVGREAAEALAARVAPRAWQWEHDGERLLAARREMARAIDDAVARGAIAADTKEVARCALATH